MRVRRQTGYTPSHVAGFKDIGNNSIDKREIICEFFRCGKTPIEIVQNNALDAEPPIASFVKSMLIGGGPVNADALPMKLMMHRWTFPLLAFVMLGCNQWPPTMMDAPSNVPADRKEIDPWTSSLLDVDVPTAYRLVGERLKSDDPKLAPLVKRMAGFVPIQVAFASERGHVRCVRQYMDAKSNMPQYDAIYIARPPAKEIIQKRLEFFDESLRSTMSEFLERFAGSGEEIEMAGQFAYDHWPTAKEFGYAEESSLGDWKEATLLYHAMNGDAVFIKPNGATAWRVLETDETIPLATTFPEFIELYADFRGTHEVFDSWAYRKFKEGRTKP